MREKYYARLCTGVSLAIGVAFSITMAYLVKSEPNDVLALGYLLYMSVGTSLFILGHTGYAYYHPAKKPHSLRSSVIYTVFFGAIWIISELSRKR